MPEKQILCMTADVSIAAAADEGENKGPPRFEVVAYTGGPMVVGGWDLPVVIDLDGMNFSNSLVANLDHDRTQRVGNVTSKMIDNGKLTLGGVASAATDAQREVVESAKNGFVWQASVEADPIKVEEVGEGKVVVVNGQEIEGPLYVARQTRLNGFGFVSHGADDNTTVAIAATASPKPRKVRSMEPQLKAWIESIGFDADALTDDQLAGLTANYEGQKAPKPRKVPSDNPFEARKAEAKRRGEIRAQADRFIEMRNADFDEIEAIERMHDHAIESNMTPQEFRLEMYEASLPGPQIIREPKRKGDLSAKVLEAAVCQAGRLPDLEKHYDDRTLQAAHDEFKGRIGLKQIFQIGAELNGGMRRNFSNDVGPETLKAAFNSGRPAIHASGFSTLSISNVISNTANKFIMRGWNMIDQACLQLAKIQPVNDFKTITTVSLTDTVTYEKVGATGEIKHGTLGDLTYTNKADTYARMLAITRQDIINDDLGALTDVPMKLGNGAMKKLNDIFWTEYLGLVGASFFAAGNSNINTGVATMTEAGLDATYVIFKDQTNPDGTPLGVEPALLVVPTALEGAARRLMSSENFNNGSTSNEGSNNIWANRFQVVSSPYISNSSYTGNTSVGWWLLANPEELPVIAIAALFGQIEPTVDTAEADFNVLGVQMRGYSDVGVSDQEYRGGVYADGGAS